MHKRINQKMLLAMLLALSLLGLNVHAKTAEPLAQTPAMGWNSWNTFGCNVDEKMIREMADAMVNSGMKDAGYEYINIDDCWHGERDAEGNIQVNKKHFPSGMKALADYVHSKGLKLGIYSDAGDTTCAHKPGSRGHEYQDAKTYAKWGIDYLKYDWCATEGLSPVGAYTTIRRAIDASGRNILLSICEWGDNQPWEWAPALGQSWRTTADIYPCWDCVLSRGSYTNLGVLPILDKQNGLRKYAGPGHWNDMDMLEVGNGLTEAEDRSHFSIWAMMATPLIAGNDLRNMSETSRKILTNKKIIALNQDKLGVQALRYISSDTMTILAKPLANDEWALLFLNRSDSPLTYTHDWQLHNVLSDDLSGRYTDFNTQRFNWSDLWNNNNGDTKQPLKLEIPPHDVVVLRLKPAR